jgi:tetratricopeptide (TPR) repeat protein
MIELYSLVKSLNSEELQVIRTNFRRTFPGDETINLAEKLFDFILAARSETPTDEQLAEVIYGKSVKMSAIAKLKSRLFQYIVDTISSDTTLSRESIFDESDRQELRIRKKMLQFRALYRKRNMSDFLVLIHLLSEIIKEAKEYELYDLLLEALNHKMLICKLRKGFDEVIDIKKQIDHYTFAQNALVKTHEYYFDLITNKVHIQKINAIQVKILFRNAIEDIEGFIAITNSAFMKYLCKMLQLDELQREGKHGATIDVCLDLISLLKRNKILYRDERMGNIYDNISQCQVYNHDHADAVLSAKKAQEFYSQHTRSFVISKEQEFYATFYSGSYRTAHAIIAGILEHPQINVGEYRSDKFVFLKACTLFKLGEYKAALNICSLALEITKDKGRGDLGLRYLKILCLVELEDHDTAYDSLEAFRKIKSRNSGKDIILLRDDLIFRALNEFAHDGFSRIPSPKLIELITTLSAKHEEHSWKYYSHELFPIHSWIQSKIKADQGVRVTINKLK